MRVPSCPCLIESAFHVGEDVFVQGDGLVGAAATTLGRLAGLP